MKLQSLGSGNSSGNNNRAMPAAFGKKASKRHAPAIVMALFSFFLLIAAGSLVISSLGKTQASEKQPTQQIAVEKPAAIEMEEVIVPTKNFEANQPIDPTFLAKVSLPRSAIPLGAVRVFEELDGMYTRGPIPANQPIVKAFLTKDRPANPVVANIPEGFRAVTINVTALTGVEGWARAGAHVDVQWINEGDGSTAPASGVGVKVGGPQIMAIVQNAKVISAERRLDANTDPAAPVPTTVTLLVDEIDAQKISLTSNAGTLILHMRGTGDSDISNITSTPLTLPDLLDGPKEIANDAAIQGVAKVKRADGKTEEWAVMHDGVVRR